MTDAFGAGDEESVALLAGLRAPAHARAWLSERGADLPSPLLDDALLVASELVTNAVRHGRPQITLSLRHLRDGVRISVADEGEHIPDPTFATPTADRPTGRGLLIVAATARDWGIAAHSAGRGKTVWAELTSDP